MPRIQVEPADSYETELTSTRVSGEQRTTSETVDRADTVRPVYLHFPRL